MEFLTDLAPIITVIRDIAITGAMIKFIINGRKQKGAKNGFRANKRGY